MSQPQVSLFVGDDLPTALDIIRLRNKHIAAPAARSDRLVETHQHPAALETLAAPPAYDAQHPDDRPQGPPQRHDSPQREYDCDKLPPHERFVRRLCGKRLSCRKRLCGKFANHRDDAQGQHEREQQHPQEHDSIEAMQRLAAQQQLEKEAERRQTQSRPKAVYQQSVHLPSIGFRARSDRAVRATPPPKFSPPRRAPKRPRDRSFRNNG